MDKLKSVLSHREKKADGSSNDQKITDPITNVRGEGSHLHTANEQPHPIYDEFHGKQTHDILGEPTKTTDDAPHFSNTPAAHPIPQSVKERLHRDDAPINPIGQDAATTLSPLSDRRTGTDVSNASIKSGVTGLPQGKPSPIQHSQEPEVVTDTNREFPLAGGVTSRKQAESGPDHSNTLSESPTYRDTGSNKPGVVAGTTAAVTGALSSAAAAVYPGSKDKHADQGEKFGHPTETSPSQSTVLSDSSTHKNTDSNKPGVMAGTTAAVTGALSSAAAAVYPGSKDKHTGQDEYPRQHTETTPSQSNVLSVQTHPQTTAGTDNQRGGLSGATSTVGGALSSAAAAVYPGSKDKHSDLGDKHNQATETLPSYSSPQPESRNLPSTTGSPDSREAFPGAAAAVYPDSKHKHSDLEDKSEGTARPTGKKGGILGAAAAITGALSGAAAAVYGSKDKNVEDNKPATTRGDSYSKVHVPGQFPDPTPVEERAQPTFTGRQDVPGQFPDPTPVEERSQPTFPSEHAKPDQLNVTSMPDESDYKPDTAMAGTVGAGLGAYPPGAHPSNEVARSPNDGHDKSLKHEDNPYTASQLDPRVDAKPGISSGTQPIAPSAISPSHDREGVDQARQPEHHTGRNVVFAGAGGAALGGLYANQRGDKDKSDTGPTSSTTGPHKSDTANFMDPGVQTEPQQHKSHHVGSTHEDSASQATGPHKSNAANIVDPRVKSEPEKTKDHSTDGPHKSDMLNRLDPRVKSQDKQEDQHHHDRDAGVLGGAGAAGFGANEAAKHYDEHPATQPSSKLEDQRYDPSAKGAHDPNQPHQDHHGRDAATGAAAGALGYGAYQAAKPSEDTSYTQPQSHEHHQPAQQAVHQPSQRSQTTQANQPTEHHYGRDAALAGGAGAVGYGAYKASHPGSDSTQKPYEDQQHIHQPTPQHIEQQGQQAYPGQQSYQPSTQPTQQPEQHQHHHGRDAALVGGTGAAGYGAYKASQPEDHTHEAQKPYSSQQPLQHSQPQQYQQPAQQPQQAQQPQHHYGRDAALAGGAGAAGYGAYKAFQPDDEASRTAPKPYETQQPAQHHTQPLTQQPASGAQKPTQDQLSHQRYDSVAHPQQQQQPQDEHHYKRDAAVAGGAGLAGVGAAYGYSQHEAEQAEKERLKQLEKEQKQHQKELEHQQREQQKELEKQQKHEQHEAEKQRKHEEHEAEKQRKHDEKVAEKEAKKEEKALQKEHEKEQKYAAKVAAAEEKKHQKEEEKELKHAAEVAAAKEKQHEKEVEKEQRHAAEVAAAEEKRRQHELEQQQLAMQKQREAEEKEQHQEEPKEKKHHHILPFLHRDKKDKQKATDEQKVSPSTSPRHSRDHGRLVTTEDAYGPEAVSRNKLHKDPPPGHPAHEALGGKIEQLGTEGPLHIVKPDEKLHSGVYGIHDTPGDNSGPTGPTGTNY